MPCSQVQKIRAVQIKVPPVVAIHALQVWIMFRWGRRTFRLIICPQFFRWTSSEFTCGEICEEVFHGCHKLRHRMRSTCRDKDIDPTSQTLHRRQFIPNQLLTLGETQENTLTRKGRVSRFHGCAVHSRHSPCR